MLLIVGASVVAVSTFLPWATLIGGVNMGGSAPVSGRLNEDAFHLLRLISVPQSDGSTSLHFGSFPWYANVGGILSIGAILMLGSVATVRKRGNFGINSSWRLLLVLVVGLVAVILEAGASVNQRVEAFQLDR